MRHYFASWIAVATIGVMLVSVGPARAAEITLVQGVIFDQLNNLSIDVDSGLGFNLTADGEIRCNYFLNGPIEAGDLDRIKQNIKPWAGRDSDHIPRLCLNSEGGSWSEGLAVARYLIDENIGTAVPAGAYCYSACSIIFMGGSYPWKGEINRFLHVKGDVGFHAPYVTGLPDENYKNEVVSQAYSEGTSAIRELMKLGVGNEVKRFPPELMAEMLEKGPNEVFAIDTVGKAIRFRVHLYGARENPKVDKAAFCNACINMNYKALESYGKGGANDLCGTDAAIEEKPFPQGKRMISDLAPRGGTCAIDVQSKDGKVSKWTFVDADAQWNDGLELAYWYLSSPSTPIKDLYDGKPDAALTKADGTPFELPVPQPAQGRDIAAELTEFIKTSYLGHGKPNFVNSEDIFAPEVDYYDQGRVPRSAVMQDHGRYDKKWPHRTFEMIADSLQFSDATDTTVNAVFRYAFQVSNGAKHLGGIGMTELSIQLRDGHFEITRESGRVVSKN